MCPTISTATSAASASTSRRATRSSRIVNFRGFTASPLLGVPQGLSVFQDGVRVNDPFGDVVNWDLIPQGAISTMVLIPGSNPVFGLNTLGGSLSINTKSGREYPGGSATLYGGSFDTYNGNVEYGGVKDNFDYYIYANYYDSNGWRDYAPSLVRQVFGKVGYQTADFDLGLELHVRQQQPAGAAGDPARHARRQPEARVYLAGHHGQRAQRAQPAAEQSARRGQDPGRQRVLARAQDHQHQQQRQRPVRWQQRRHRLRRHDPGLWPALPPTTKA